MNNMNNYIFSEKEMYRMACSESGKLRKYMNMSSSQRRKSQYNNMHLMEGMSLSDKNDFPVLKPYRGRTDWEVHPFCNHNKLCGINQALHFFMDDYKFSHALWERLEQTTSQLLKFDCLFTPDYSLYVDVPQSLNKWNVYRSRFVGAFWQSIGIDVIPTFSWGNVDSLAYSLEGLPEGCVLATCGTGIAESSTAFRLWCYGMQRVQEELCPKLIFVYGDPVTIPGFQTEIRFMETVISKHFRRHENRL